MVYICIDYLLQLNVTVDKLCNCVLYSSLLLMIISSLSYYNRIYLFQISRKAKVQ